MKGNPPQADTSTAYTGNPQSGDSIIGNVQSWLNDLEVPGEGSVTTGGRNFSEEGFSMVQGSVASNPANAAPSVADSRESDGTTAVNTGPDVSIVEAPHSLTESTVWRGTTEFSASLSPVEQITISHTWNTRIGISEDSGRHYQSQAKK